MPTSTKPAPVSLADAHVHSPQRRCRSLRVTIVSDAIAGRNGVGTYYQDLMEHLRGEVDSIHLIGPTQQRDRFLERFSVPMPGDTTQRMIVPRGRELRRRLSATRPNLIILPSLGACSYHGLRYAKRHALPVIVVNHTDFDRLLELYWPGWMAKPLGGFLRRINRWLLTQADRVAALNTDAYEDARKLGAESIRIMGTPVASAFLRTPRSPLRERISRVIFIGRLAMEKGLDQVLDAARQNASLEFAIAGDGPGRKQVQAAADRLPNLRYLGWLSRQQVLEALDGSDALVLPSSIEAFGTVALEALCRQRCVLVRPRCGIAKWPSLAKGLFYLGENESVAEGLRRLTNSSHEQRIATASIGWEAVEDFNRHTVRLWLDFLTDAAIPVPPSVAHITGTTT